MHSSDFPLEQNEIPVPEEPEPTTSIIPFAKDDVIGRSIHMIFDLEDSYSFFKGKIISQDAKTGLFFVEFWDGDTANLDFVSGGDTILWETREITRNGRWKQCTKKETIDEGIMQDTGAISVDDEKEGASVQKHTKAGKKSGQISNNCDSMQVDGDSNGIKVTNDARGSNKALKRKDGVAELGKEQAHKKQMVDTAGDHGRARKDAELRATINRVGQEFLKNLRDLESSIHSMNELAENLKVFLKAAELKDDNQIGVVKTIRGFLNTILKKKGDMKEKEMGIDKVWPLNDLVMKSISTLHGVASNLCQKAKLPHVVDGGVLDRWRHEKNLKLKAKTLISPKVEEVKELPVTLTPLAKTKQVSSPKTSGWQSDMKPPKGPKVGWEAFASTGNSTRDDAIKIFAHSLMTAETPFEIAVDIEQALYAKSREKEDTSGDLLGDDYYKSIKGVWEILNRDSGSCSPFMRIMMLEGYIKAQDLVSLSAQECKNQQKCFLDDCQQKI